METPLVLFISLLSCTYAQYMSTWGSSTGYGNSMHMPMPYTHGMPYHHGMLREAGMESVPLKSDSMMIYRAKVPARTGVQDYSLLNVNLPEHEELDHLIYRQSVNDMKRPVVGVLSLLSTPMPMAFASMNSMGTNGGMNAMGNKASYVDPSTDDLMTCVGMDMTEPLKVHTEPRIIINRAFPYYPQSMHKIKQ